MDWELTKENCVPVRQGRTKAVLQELADPATTALEAKRKELWAEITEYKGDDPLEPWQRYIKWMQEYGVGGGKADLMKVLEAGTKELLKYPRYTNDIRFLRIWIQYADCLPDPDDVFLFLKERGIGREFALYYEAYATYFELKGNFQGADAVYTDGIQRGVKQLERLKLKHAAFQQRMAQRVQRQIQEEQVLGPPAQEPVRVNLGTLGARGSGSGQQQTAGGVFGVAAAPSQPAALFGPRPGAPQQTRAAQPTIGLHADDEFTGFENPRPWMHGYARMPQVNSSRELQPYGVRRKENLDRATQWNQAPLLPGASTAATGPPVNTASGLAIFTDEEFQEDLPPRPMETGQGRGIGASSSAASTGQSILLPGSDRSAGLAPAGADSLMLSLAPPRTFLRGAPPGPSQSVSEAIAALSMSAAAPAAPGSVSAQQLPLPLQHPVASKDPSGTAAVAVGLVARELDGPSSSRGSHLSTSALAVAGIATGRAPAAATAASGISATTGEEEMSYDELRAIAWFQRNPAPRPSSSCLANGGGASNSTEQGRAKAMPAAADPSLPALRSQPSVIPGSNTTAWRGAADAETAAGQTSTASASRKDAGPATIASQRAPFSQVLPAAVLAQPALTSYEDSCATGQGNGQAAAAKRHQHKPWADAAPSARVPLGEAIHAPGPTMNSGPQQRAPLRHDPPDPAGSHASGLAGPRDRRQEDAQPTVTISTRGAFDLMNSFFSEDLPHQRDRADRSRSRPTGTAVESLPAAAPQASAHPLWQPSNHARPTSASAPAMPPPQPLSQPTAQAAEPTVTLHTKLAFDALNDMFSDTLPHEEARKLARHAAPDGIGRSCGALSAKPFSNADVCRLANAGRNSVAAAPATGRKEPFGGVSGGSSYGSAHAVHPLHRPAPAEVPSLAIHEDTFFLGPEPGGLPSDAARGCVGGVGGRPAQPAEQPRGHPHAVAAMYEDTEFMPQSNSFAGQGTGSIGARRGVVPSSSGFILEDTEFVTRHAGPHMASASGAAGYSHGLGSYGGVAASVLPASRATSRDVCTGKQSNGRNMPGEFQQRNVPKGPLQVYEDTQYNLDD